MPDDHWSTSLTIMSDDNYVYHEVADISDINYGKSFEEDIMDVINTK